MCPPQRSSSRPSPRPQPTHRRSYLRRPKQALLCQRPRSGWRGPTRPPPPSHVRESLHSPNPRSGPCTLSDHEIAQPDNSPPQNSPPQSSPPQSSPPQDNPPANGQGQATQGPQARYPSHGAHRPTSVASGCAKARIRAGCAGSLLLWLALGCIADGEPLRPEHGTLPDATLTHAPAERVLADACIGPSCDPGKPAPEDTHDPDTLADDPSGALPDLGASDAADVEGETLPTVDVTPPPGSDAEADSGERGDAGSLPELPPPPDDRGSGPCPSGLTLCEDQCTSLSHDPLHCGGCARRCPEGLRCSGARCLAPRFVRLQASRDATCALSEERGLWCWGRLPDEDEPTLAPRRLAMEGPVLDLAASGESVCAVLSDGALRCRSTYPGMLAAAAATTLLPPLTISGPGDIVCGQAICPSGPCWRCAGRVVGMTRNARPVAGPWGSEGPWGQVDLAPCSPDLPCAAGGPSLLTPSGPLWWLADGVCFHAQHRVACAPHPARDAEHAADLPLACWGLSCGAPQDTCVEGQWCDAQRRCVHGKCHAQGVALGFSRSGESLCGLLEDDRGGAALPVCTQPRDGTPWRWTTFPSPVAFWWSALIPRGNTLATGREGPEGFRCLLRTNGVDCSGASPLGELGTFSDAPLAAHHIALPSWLQPASELVAGGAHHCVLGGSGRIGCWGDNRRGQLGTGSRAGRLDVTPIHLGEVEP